MNALLRTTLLSLSLLAFAGPAVAAPGDDAAHRKEAQVLFGEGVKQAEKGDTKAALASFRAAYEKYPSFRVLYNIGQLCERMGDPACAVKSYEQYLRDGGADVPAKRRTEVDATIKKLVAQLAMVTVKVSAPGAEVAIDDVPQGRSPIAEPVPMNAGPHKVTATLGDKSAKKEVVANAGEPQTVELELPKDEPAPIVVAPPPVPKDPPRQEPVKRDAGRTEPSKFPVVPWVVTGGLAVVTIVTGVITASKYSTYQDKKDAFPVTRSELDDAQGSARTMFVVTSIFGAATVVSAGIATYLTLSPKRASSPRVGLAPGGIVFGGTLP